MSQAIIIIIIFIIIAGYIHANLVRSIFLYATCQTQTYDHAIAIDRFLDRCLIDSGD